MGSMVGSLTTGTKYEHLHDEMVSVVEKMKVAINEFECILMQDKESFEEYMTALGMPKVTVDEQTVRSKAI